MRRVKLAGLFAAAAFLLTACGNSSITVLRTSPAAAIVITSDSNAISSLKPKIQAQLLQAGESLVDGDQHTGDRICGFSLSKNGHSYQVDAYGNLPNTTCSEANQAGLKSQLP